MNNTQSYLLAVILVGALVLSGCSRSTVSGTDAVHAPGDLAALLNDNHGRVLILLLGRDGCPGTAKATAMLDEYVLAKPEQVSIMRLDIPLPNEDLKLTSEWKHSFPRFVDTGRKIANKLEFFYYPTLYVFDKQGENRYIGALDNANLAAMVQEILAEKPSGKKKIYTLPMPAVGEKAPAFSGVTLTGDTVSRDSLMGKHGLLVVFGRTSCRFSAADMPQFKDIADRFIGKGVNTVIVNQQEELSAIKQVYMEKCSKVPVIWDRNGDICKSFGVDAVPFFFLLNNEGKIISRRSFTHAAAENSINAMLGLGIEKPRFKPTEGG